MLKNTIYTLIISILLATTSLVGYFYSVVYVGGMGSDLGDMYKKSNELNREEEALNSIKRVAQNADQRNAEISQFIIPVENEGSIKFVKTLEDTAERYGLKPNTNSIEIVSDDNLSKINKEYLSIKMTLTGPELSVSNFVKKIESLPFNTKITSYSLTNIKGLTSGQQLDCTILVIKEK